MMHKAKCGCPGYKTNFMSLRIFDSVTVFEMQCRGTSLLWTPLGPDEVSCIERCPHFRGKFISRKHIWDVAKCP